MLSGLYELKDVVNGTAEGAVGVGPTAVATVLAFVTGYASIAFLLRFLTTHTTGVFVEPGTTGADDADTLCALGRR